MLKDRSSRIRRSHHEGKPEAKKPALTTYTRVTEPGVEPLGCRNKGDALRVIAQALLH